MNAFEFTHQIFLAIDWEFKLKKFIEDLDCRDNIIWYKKREHKKINEELSVLGYYVKYRYGQDESISFKLNKSEGKADGWIFRNGTQIEAVQIAIAFYQAEEARIDNRLMNGDDVDLTDWAINKVELLKNRVEERIIKKSDMGYQDIDTLLIGLRDYFVRRINNHYDKKKVEIIKSIEPSIDNSGFKEIVLVDSDLIGKGELLIIPNNANSQGCDPSFSMVNSVKDKTI